MTVYLYDNFLFLRQILTLMCQITSEGYFSGNFRSPGGSCQLWLAHPLALALPYRGVQAPGGSGEKPSVEAVQLKKYFEKKKSGS